MLSSRIDTGLATWYARLTMPPKDTANNSAALNIRNIPRSLFYRLKMAAAVEEQSVSELVRSLIEGKIQELEKKGLLPKEK